MKIDTIIENQDCSKEDLKKYKLEALKMLDYEINNLIKLFNKINKDFEPLFNNNEIKKKELLEEIKSCINQNLIDKCNTNIKNFKEKVIVKQDKNEIINNINFFVDNITKFKMNTKDFFNLNDEVIDNEFFDLFDEITILLLSIYHLNKMLYDNI